MENSLPFRDSRAVSLVKTGLLPLYSDKLNFRSSEYQSKQWCYPRLTKLRFFVLIKAVKVITKWCSNITTEISHTTFSSSHLHSLQVPFTRKMSFSKSALIEISHPFTLSHKTQREQRLLQASQRSQNMSCRVLPVQILLPFSLLQK